ncbi:predicted protein [Naegleria gruberi]|uniref:Predicted protein n=1 Tax=Naegleria gruberi TaxID=5762 RepID=D2VDB0_NAEGR|nr:uncharacterized protein NAEGRDRAFT_66781 [Naegleria gruberi]EFC45201.1 predicted protein [Naegleria gruberi]|eukprot:XP_002677945.1 predicted protein [Naegleria gruberi strain NEG-M]
MQVLNLTNVYALNHVFSPSHLPHFHTDDHVETEFVEKQHSILLLPEMIQSVGYEFLTNNPENDKNYDSHKSTPFLFYKFRSNRGLTGHVIYNVLQRKRQVDHSPQTFQPKKKKKEDRLVTVRMIDVSDSPIFHPNKYALSGSALTASLGKHTQFFSDHYVTIKRREIGKVEEMEPNIPHYPSDQNFEESEGTFTERDELEGLDEWVEEHFLKNRTEFDYLKVMRHRMLNFKSKLRSGKGGSAHSSNVEINSMKIIENLGYSSKIRIDVLIEMTKLMEIEILNQILTDLQKQREIERSDMLQVEKSISGENNSDILLEDKLLMNYDSLFETPTPKPIVSSTSKM